MSNQSGAVITLGISSSNVDRQIGILGVSNVSTGTSIVNLNQRVGLLGVSNVSTNQQIGLLGVSSSRFLQRNELVLPSSFNTATLTTLNTTDNILVKSSGGNSYLYFNTNTSTDVNLVGMVVSNLTIRNSTSTGNILFQTAGPNNRLTIDSSGNSTFAANVTVNGTLSSPITTLLGVSCSNFLQRNEIVLPPTFTTASISGLKGNLTVSGSSIYSAPSLNLNLYSGYSPDQAAYIKISNMTNTSRNISIGTDEGGSGEIIAASGLKVTVGDAVYIFNYLGVAYAPTSWSILSSRKHKSHIRDLHGTTDYFMKLRFKSYDKFVGKANEHLGDLGLIIEDIEELGDDFHLIGNVNDEKFLNYNKVFVMACREVQKLEGIKRTQE